jgi:hypothetical protein
MKRILTIISLSTIIYSCADKNNDANSVHYDGLGMTVTYDSAMPSQAQEVKAQLSEEDLKYNLNIEFIKYCNAYKNQDLNVIMDYLFYPAMAKAGYSRATLREGFNQVAQEGLLPTNIEFFSPTNYCETNQYYIFTIPIECDMQIDGSIARFRNKVFGFSDKNTEGKIWMFMDNSETSEQVISNSFPDINSKLSFSKPEIISYRQSTETSVPNDNPDPDEISN